MNQPPGPPPLDFGFCTPSLPETNIRGDDDRSHFINRLHQGQPNPFKSRTTLRFTLAQGGRARLVIYDASGRRVRTLVDGPQEAGLHEAIWDGTDDLGKPVASGVYRSQLHTDRFASNKKIVASR